MKAKEVIEVRGRVLDPDGKPVAGAKLYLSSREKEAMNPIRATSDGDGHFTFRYSLSGSPSHDSADELPPWRLWRTDNTRNEYQALVLLEPKQVDKALVKDITVERALERKGRVVGPDGQPISGIAVSGLESGVNYRGATVTLQGAEFTVRGINPRRNREIIFYHKEKNLGYCPHRLPDEKLGPLTIKLQPCGSVSGRIVDPDGAPMVDNKRVSFQDEMAFGHSFSLDKEGRFYVQGLVPGLACSIFDRKRGFELRGGIVVEPGKDKDLGDIKVSDK